MSAYFDQFIGSRGVTGLKGVRNVVRNINIQLASIQGRTLKGMLMGAALIHNETEKGTVKVPVDTGNLRHSWFIVSSAAKIVSGGGKTRTVDGGGGFTGPNAGRMAAEHSAMLKSMKARAYAYSSINDGPFVFMGYSANYAFWVHEMLDVGPWDEVEKKGFKRKGSGPKWFEYAIKKQEPNIINIIRKNARIK